MSVAMRVSLLVALLATVALVIPARGAPDPGVHRDTEHRYTLALAGGWHVRPVPAGSRAPLASFVHRSSGTLLAVTRVDHPNPEAWIARTFPAYASEVEEGLRSRFVDYQRVDLRTHKVDIVPALDLAFRHRKDEKSDEIVFLRFLFFRRYSLIAAVAMPATTSRGQKARHRATLDTFVPYLTE